jgi:hypothetical protein
MQVAAGGSSSTRDRSAEYARMFSFRISDGGIPAARRAGRRLPAAVVALYEPKKMFGTVGGALRPFVALFELAYARLAEREARDEATRSKTSPSVHGEYAATAESRARAHSRKGRSPGTHER